MTDANPEKKRPKTGKSSPQKKKPVVNRIKKDDLVSRKREPEGALKGAPES